MTKKITFLILLSSVVSFGQVDFTEQVLSEEIVSYTLSEYPIDFDGDGDIDFATANSDVWLENSGNNIFIKRTITVFPQATQGYYVRRFLIDFDSDGDQDFIWFTNPDGNYWIENLGNNNFTANALNIIGPLSANKPFDFDEDGDIDLFSFDNSTTPITIILNRNDGNQNFIAEPTAYAINFLTGYYDDIDQDNDQDIIKVSNSSTLEIHENDGANNYTLHTIDNLPSSFAYNISFEDLDSDGDKDIFLVQPDNNTNQRTLVTWYENTQGFNFIRHELPNISDTGLYKKSYFKDMNNDSYLDIVWVAYNLSGYFHWFENDGNQNYIKHTIDPNTSSTSGRIHVADLNNDTFEDIILLSKTANNSVTYRLRWYINDGNGNFTTHLKYLQNSFSSSTAGVTSVIDIDNDTDLDFVAINADAKLVFFENTLDPVIEPEPLGKCYNEFENSNWISNCSFDLQGRLTSSGVSYFNSLGKATQSQTTDIKTGRIWASQTIYDYHGRPSFQSLSAPIDSINYGYKNFVLKSNGTNLTTADVESITEENTSLPVINNQENTLGWYYSENNTREPYQDITTNPYSKSVYSHLNPGTVLKTLGGNKVTIDGQEKWLNGYSFTMPVAQELFYAFGKDVFPQRESLESANGGQNFTGNAYCVISPIDSSTEYLVKVTSLNVATLELNAIYRFNLTNNLSGVYELLSVIYEDDLLEQLQDCFNLGDEQAEQACEDAILAQLGALEAGQTATGQVEGYTGIPYYIKATKTVSRDVHGIETVVFTDADGNTLAAARSGNEENSGLDKYEVVSTIGEQDFVDIHIPVGCDGPVQFEGMNGLEFRIFDLVSEQEIASEILPGTSYTLSAGMYRIERRSPFIIDHHGVPLKFYLPIEKPSFITIDNNDAVDLIDTEMMSAVRYKVNYYDYSLNYYDKANRLVKSVQPLGFDNTNLVNDTFNAPNHNYISTFDYNTLGQLQESTSPDEGSAQFKYRKDGQIRFSQNSKQVNANEFSYTNYDNLGRPIESGVLEGTAFTSVDPDTSNFTDQCNEVIYPMVFAALLSSAVSQHIDYYFIDNYNELIELNEIINGNVASQIEFDFPFPVNLTGGSVTVTDITQFRQIIQNAINTCTFNNKKEQHFTKYDQASLFGLHVALIEENIPIRNNYEQQQFVAGNVAKTFTQNPNTTTTWYSYDVYGRVQWLVQKIDGLGNKTIDYEYDQTTGEVTKVCYQKHVPTEMFIHNYKYNIAGQLTAVSTSTDNINFTNQAKYEYYETGALKRTELADNLQGIDYTYNLGGQLKAINHPSGDANLDPGKDGTNDFAADMFGAGLDYFSGDFQRTNTPTPIASFAEGINQFNGNIKSISWKTNNPNTSTAAAYNYSYNKNNWLTSANFTADIGDGGTTEVNITKNNILTTNEDVVASESITLLPGFHAPAGIEFTAVITPTTDSPGTNDGDYNVSNLSYDVNGNILSLNRNKHTENGSNKMDQLSYGYKANKNQLDHVSDAITETTNANDIKTQSAGNYTYNLIGQLESNTEEGINYIYNASGLVTEVQKNNQSLVKFYYNDKGYRVRKESFANGTLTDTDYYIRDAAGAAMAIYRNGSQVEVPIYGAERLGIYYKQSGTSAYQLTDHLGNVRAVVLKDGQNALSLTSSTDYYPFGMPMPNRNIVGDYRYAYQGQEKDPETGKEAFQLRLWDGRIGRWLTTDPMGEFSSPYLGMGNNPINKIDPNGGHTDDWVKRADGSIYWDPNANSQATTKAGETWLGTTLTFDFNSFIDGELWDGPGGTGQLVDPTGDKLITSITLTGQENSKGELTGISTMVSSNPGPTPVGTARDYYPGEGGSDNGYIASFSSGNYNLSFEQHASVSSIEEYGLNSMGYKIVDVAQKLNISVHNGNLSFSAYTNIFPSATLDINGQRYIHYKQPSFIKTHKAPWSLEHYPKDTRYYPSAFFKRN